MSDSNCSLLALAVWLSAQSQALGMDAEAGPHSSNCCLPHPGHAQVPPLDASLRVPVVGPTWPLHPSRGSFSTGALSTEATIGVQTRRAEGWKEAFESTEAHMGSQAAGLGKYQFPDPYCLLGTTVT